MSTLPKAFITPEEYLEMERKADFRSEYLRGEMFAMAGGSPVHAELAARVIQVIGSQLRGSPCKTFNTDLRIWIESTGLYTYPDLSVICGPLELAAGQTDCVTNPTVLVEVLSPSTEAYDRGAKFGHYRTIRSLQHYVLVAQDRKSIDVFTRRPEGWLLTSANQPGEKVTLEAAGCELALDDVYEGVEISPLSAAAAQGAPQQDHPR